MKVFSFEVSICGTIYVRAEDEKEALRKLSGAFDGETTCLDMEKHYHGIPIDGRRFDDPELPEVSLAPVMTVYQRRWKQGELLQASDADLAEDLDEEDAA